MILWSRRGRSTHRKALRFKRTKLFNCSVTRNILRKWEFWNPPRISRFRVDATATIGARVQDRVLGREGDCRSHVRCAARERPGSGFRKALG